MTFLSASVRTVEGYYKQQVENSYHLKSRHRLSSCTVFVPKVAQDSCQNFALAVDVSKQLKKRAIEPVDTQIHPNGYSKHFLVWKRDGSGTIAVGWPVDS